MDTIVFGNLTLRDILLPVILCTVVLIILFRAIKSLLGKKNPDDVHAQFVKCTSCGWQGRVSRYAGRCPSCNEPLGERKAKQ